MNVKPVYNTLTVLVKFYVLTSSGCEIRTQLIGHAGPRGTCSAAARSSVLWDFGHQSDDFEQHSDSVVGRAVCVQDRGHLLTGTILRNNFKDNKMTTVLQKKVQRTGVNSL